MPFWDRFKLSKSKMERLNEVEEWRSNELLALPFKGSIQQREDQQTAIQEMYRSRHWN